MSFSTASATLVADTRKGISTVDGSDPARIEIFVAPIKQHVHLRDLVQEAGQRILDQLLGWATAIVRNLVELGPGIGREMNLHCFVDRGTAWPLSSNALPETHSRQCATANARKTSIVNRPKTLRVTTFAHHRLHIAARHARSPKVWPRSRSS
jgi:hypothetical protein